MAGRGIPKDDEEDDFSDIRAARKLAGKSRDTGNRSRESSGSRRNSPQGNRNSHALSTKEAATAGLRIVADMTGKQLSGLTSIEPVKDGEGWRVVVEVVEDRRIPSSADILAQYEAMIDEDGELLAYRQKSRYPRGSGNDRSL